MAENIEYNETGSKFVLKPDNEKIDVPVGGEAFVYNSLAAISVGKLLNIPLAEIKEGIKSLNLAKWDWIFKNRARLYNNKWLL